MTRIKWARIALRLFALANIGLIAANWPRSSKLTGFATMIVCGGAFLPAYREQPARFHRRVGRTEAIGIILAPLISLASLFCSREQTCSREYGQGIQRHDRVVSQAAQPQRPLPHPAWGAASLAPRPAHGTAVIRDNIPLIEKVLARTLVGMAPREWYETLNGRVFFWVSEVRLERLRNAPAYREREHDILIVDTAALLSSHVAEVTLSPMNSGATHPGAKYTRGTETFKPIDSYPWTFASRRTGTSQSSS
jgi:hypothetical protein